MGQLATNRAGHTSCSLTGLPYCTSSTWLAPLYSDQTTRASAGPGLDGWEQHCKAAMATTPRQSFRSPTLQPLASAQQQTGHLATGLLRHAAGTNAAYIAGCYSSTAMFYHISLTCSCPSTTAMLRYAVPCRVNLILCGAVGLPAPASPQPAPPRAPRGPR